MEIGTVSCNTFKGAAAVFFYEAFGTFILLTAINFSKQDPLIVPCGLFMAAMTCGGFTGGHFNFAVTMGVYITEGQWRRNLPHVFLYFFAQLFGAFAGQLYSYSIMQQNTLFINPGY